ncbi:hypothetical protein B7463_g2978, partial [Scytalidium lignicola]
MVVTCPYYVDEDPAYQRGGSRSYSALDEASTPTSSEGNINGSRNFKFPAKELQGSQRNSEAENSNSQPRRRIPVACGRCRKRKIRCSGDPGNGGACINCKTSGHEVCQFLRVSSREALLKFEPPEFPYPGGSRHSPYRLMDLGIYGQQTFGSQVTIENDGLPQYRAGAVMAHPFTGRNNYATIGPYGANYADGVDYGLDSGSYQVTHPHQVEFSQSTYNPASTVRSWLSPQSRAASGSLFLDPEQSYNNTPPYYQNDMLRLQQTSSAESENFASSSLPSSLQVPAQMGNNDRVLPFPLPNRPVQIAGQYLKPQESSQLPVIQTYNRRNQGNEGRGTPGKLLKSNIDNALLSMSQPYYPMPSSQDCPSSAQFDGLQEYSNSTSNNSLFRDSAMRSDSSELSYGYGPSSGSSKRGSESTQSTSDSSISTLANGQQYVPHVQASYPAPPMIEIRPASVRRTTESLQTV